MPKKDKADMLTDKELDKVSGGSETADHESIKINHDIFDTSIKFNNFDISIKTNNNSDPDFDTKINFNNFDTSIKINNKSDIKILKND